MSRLAEQKYLQVAGHSRVIPPPLHRGSSYRTIGSLHSWFRFGAGQGLAGAVGLKGVLAGADQGLLASVSWGGGWAVPALPAAVLAPGEGRAHTLCFPNKGAEACRFANTAPPSDGTAAPLTTAVGVVAVPGCVVPAQPPQQQAVVHQSLDGLQQERVERQVADFLELELSVHGL